VQLGRAGRASTYDAGEEVSVNKKYITLSVVRFEVFTAVTMKTGVFWDMKTLFVPHKKHITSPLQSRAGQFYERFEVFTAVTMKNALFLDMQTQYVPHRKHITSCLQSRAG
jgi:hypothetical protein